tara:strand:+ start:19545 stop:20747 length:1203 start_codon:yes stop_codon:yes gene_type:complete
VKISEEHVRDLVREALSRRMLAEDEGEEVDLEVEEGPDAKLKAEIERLFTAANVVVGDSSHTEDRTARGKAIKGLAQMARDYNEGKYSGADKKYFDDRFWPKMKSLRSKGPGETAPGKKGHVRNLNTVPKKGTPPTPVVAGEEHKWLTNKGKAKAFQATLVAALGLKADVASDRRIIQRALGCRSSREGRCPDGSIGSKTRALWTLVTKKPAGKNADLPAGFSKAIAMAAGAKLQSGQQDKIKAKFKSRPKSTPSDGNKPPPPPAETPPTPTPTTPPTPQYDDGIGLGQQVGFENLWWKKRRGGSWTADIKDPANTDWPVIRFRLKPGGNIVIKGRNIDGETRDISHQVNPEVGLKLTGEDLETFKSVIRSYEMSDDLHKEISDTYFEADWVEDQGEAGV